MESRGADPEGADFQRWLGTLWHLCNLPELVFAHSALGSSGSDRLPEHVLWHQLQQTCLCCFSVQQPVASGTRYRVRDDNILKTLSHHVHQFCFFTYSPLFPLTRFYKSSGNMFGGKLQFKEGHSTNATSRCKQSGSRD